MKNKNKYLTYEELGKEFTKETGISYMSKTLDYIYSWALSKPDLFKVDTDNNNTLIKKE